jgi:Metal-dependent hydrolases of the beta-lactamase superfamily III
MNITMVGTGSAFAKRYDNNNALIEAGGFRLLLDCGITLPKALHGMGVGFDELDGILISHIHADHVGGLEELAFQMRFIYGRKPVLYIERDLIEPLWEHTLKGGLTQGELQSLDDYFDVRPLAAGEECELADGLKVKPIATRHIEGKKSFSFLFNGRFFYSADMVFDPELLLSLEEQGTETFFHECQLEPPGIVHTTLDELLTLPERLQQKIWLMHYGDRIDEYRGRTGRLTIAEPKVTYTV